MSRTVSTYTFEWNGDEVEARFRRAVGRATIGVGEGVVSHAKKFVDVISGDLMRSIHIAVARTLGEQKTNQKNVQTKTGAMLDAGSWLDYACVEEVGRGHQYMHPAIAAVRPQAYMTYKIAFKEEGF